MSGPKHYRVRRPGRYKQASSERIAHVMELVNQQQQDALASLISVVEVDPRILDVSFTVIAQAPDPPPREVSASELNKPIVDALDATWEKFVASAGNDFSIAFLDSRRREFLELCASSKDQQAVRSASAEIERLLREHLTRVREVTAGLTETGVLAKALDDEAAVGAFHEQARQAWRERYNQVASLSGVSEESTERVLQEVETLQREARAILTEAIGRQQDSEARIDLLKATIASLKSLGFFVNDPQYEDPRDPLAAVVLTATRGPEKVYISVPLAGEVRSTWDGIAEATCADGFLEYLDKLRENGFECEPTRSDLRDRPRLLKKGEKALPRGGAEGRSV